MQRNNSDKIDKYAKFASTHILYPFAVETDGGRTAAVCDVVCYMEVRPGLSGKKTRWHFSEQR